MMTFLAIICEKKPKMNPSLPGK
ncbi:hypothetical protein NC651_018863 [Populus alba x Populus x berolinensis]|nr:hypothetical protein NC651_018863 [Populus alba x Populus x berolinensis]